MNRVNTYHPPIWLFNKHLETIYPSVFRKINLAPYTRERIETKDGDFLDLDWLKNNDSENLVIICHGLEGDTTRPYIKGMAKIFNENNFEVLTWNYRGCGGEVNRLKRFYNSGATEDLDEVIKHALSLRNYKYIALIGFSLGGNLSLKFLGEGKFSSAKAISIAVAISTPIDLYQSCLKISRPQNFIYTWRFLKSLRKKIVDKAAVYPDLDLSPLKKIKTLIEFDDIYTAPLHGYRDALHYYESCQARQFMDNIKVPTLLLNAQNDPFLSDTCYPVHEFKAHKYVNIEVPLKGGHVGFTEINQNKVFWSEKRVLSFVSNTLDLPQH